MVKDYNLENHLDANIKNYKYATVTEWVLFFIVTCLSMIILYNLDGVNGFIKVLLITIIAVIISYKSTGKLHLLLSGVYNKMSINNSR